MAEKTAEPAASTGTNTVANNGSADARPKRKKIERKKSSRQVVKVLQMEEEERFSKNDSRRKNSLQAE